MSSIRIYLAAPWKHRETARQVRDAIQATGFLVISRWLDIDEKTAVQKEEAANDLQDIIDSDCMIVLNLEKSEGKAFEQGYAHGLGVPIIVVGQQRLNVFQHLDEITLVETPADAIDKVKELFGL